MLRIIAASLLLLALAVQAQPEAGFDSGSIEPGDNYLKIFREEYEQGYSYHCHPHPDMQGMVHVGADTDGTTTNHDVRIVEGANRDDWGYEPTHLYIEAGDTVTWINAGEIVHTVTEGGEGHVHDHGTSADAHDHDSHAHDGEDSPVPVGLALVALLVAIAARR